MIRTHVLRTVCFALVVALLTSIVDHALLSPSPAMAAPQAARATYKCVQFDGNGGDGVAIEKALNEMTSEGWEFQSAAFCTLIFKK